MCDDLICLRELRDSDARALWEMRNDDRVYLFLPTYLVERQYEDPHEAIRQMRGPCFEQRESLFWAVCLREDDELCGLVELYEFRDDLHKVSIGYRFAERFWGQGIATRAVTLVVDYLYSQTNIEIICADTMVSNGASARVLEKSGFIGTAKGVGEEWGYEYLTPADKWFT